MPRFDADWIDYMLRAERRGSPPAEDTLAYLSIEPGHIVADVGCGPGFFTLPLAHMVAPNGHVYAIDVEPSMLDLVSSRSAAAGLSGIETIRADGTRIPLADALVDLTLCGLLLHDLPDRTRMVRELIRVTRPGGRVAVVEWMPEKDDSRPNRLRPEDVAFLFEEAGRQMTEVTPLGTHQYLLVGGRASPLPLSICPQMERGRGGEAAFLSRGFNRLAQEIHAGPDLLETRPAIRETDVVEAIVGVREEALTWHVGDPLLGGKRQQLLRIRSLR